jgi:hypothetical protein
MRVATKADNEREKSEREDEREREIKRERERESGCNENRKGGKNRQELSA